VGFDSISAAIAALIAAGNDIQRIEEYTGEVERDLLAKKIQLLSIVGDLSNSQTLVDEAANVLDTAVKNIREAKQAEATARDKVLRYCSQF